MNNNKLKEIDIKNRTYYNFDDIINIKGLSLDNILLDEKSYEKCRMQNYMWCKTTYYF